MNLKFLNIFVVSTCLIIASDEMESQTQSGVSSTRLTVLTFREDAPEPRQKGSEERRNRLVEALERAKESTLNPHASEYLPVPRTPLPPFQPLHGLNTSAKPFFPRWLKEPTNAASLDGGSSIDIPTSSPKKPSDDTQSIGILTPSPKKPSKRPENVPPLHLSVTMKANENSSNGTTCSSWIEHPKDRDLFGLSQQSSPEKGNAHRQDHEQIQLFGNATVVPIQPKETGVSSQGKPPLARRK